MAEREEEKKVQPLKNCIRFWEALLFHNAGLMSPSTVVMVEATIKHLKGEAD